MHINMYNNLMQSRITVIYKIYFYKKFCRICRISENFLIHKLNYGRWLTIPLNAPQWAHVHLAMLEPDVEWNVLNDHGGHAKHGKRRRLNEWPTLKVGFHYRWYFYTQSTKEYKFRKERESKLLEKNMRAQNILILKKAFY